MVGGGEGGHSLDLGVFPVFDGVRVMVIVRVGLGWGARRGGGYVSSKPPHHFIVNAIDAIVGILIFLTRNFCHVYPPPLTATTMHNIHGILQY